MALDEAFGKHNGTVGGRQFFECEWGHGVIVSLSKVYISTIRVNIHFLLPYKTALPILVGSFFSPSFSLWLPPHAMCSIAFVSSFSLSLACILHKC